MRTVFLILLSALSFIYTKAETAYTKQDSLLYEKYAMRFASKAGLPLHELVIQTALYFKESPYVASTLENNKEEQLTINLRQFDCTTFVETCIALSRTLKSDTPSFSEFCHQLQLIRYRDGKISGYSSRLHYVTDWIYDNERKNLLSDKSIVLGGITDSKTINFMSTHSESYKQLRNDARLQSEIKDIEDRINEQKRYRYIKKADINKNTDRIKNGDIIVFATSINGLDYSHIGIAYRNKNRLTFIHASTKYMKVVVEPLSLSDYCMKSSKCTGISVLRLNE